MDKKQPIPTKQQPCDEKLMTRKEAVTKAGIIGLSAATMMLLLKSPVKAQTTSPTIDTPGNPGDF